VKPDRDVLERNLAKLFARAYEPVRAREEFRSKLGQEFTGRARRLASSRRRARPWSSPALRVALAASIAVLAFVAVRANAGSLAAVFERWFGSPGGPTLEAILARGEVAWRGAPGASWSAHAGAEEEPLAVLAPFAEIATPAQRSVALDLGPAPAQSWSLFSDSRVEVARDADGWNVALASGGLLARRGDESADERARVATAEGAVDVFHGSVRVAYEAPEDLEQWSKPRQATERFVHVSVRSGRASVRAPNGAGELLLDSADEVFLAGGETLVPIEPSTGEGERVGVSASDPAVVASPPEVRRGLHGVVRSAGAPLAAFRIVALREANLPQIAQPIVLDRSGTNGEYELPGLVPGRYRVFAIAPGLAAGRSEFVDVRLGVPTRVDIDLDRGGTLAGVVVDAATNEPISDAYVVSETDTPLAVLSFRAADNDGLDRAVRTRGNGAFEFELVGARRQVIRASAPGHGAAWIELDVAPGGERRDLEFRLQRSGRIAGSVLDVAGVPQPGVIVLAATTDFESKRPSLSYTPAVTDAEGRFELEDLGAGAWAVLRFGPPELMASGSLTPEFAFSWVRAGETTEVNFHAKKPLRMLRGVVRDARGAPVSGRSLMIARADSDPSPFDEGWSSCATLADGSYKFPGLEPGAYCLFISGRTPSEMVYAGPVEVQAAPETVQDLALPGGRIDGVLHDGERSRPMDGGVLVLYREGADGARDFAGKVLTDERGRFEFEFVPAGRYELWGYSAREVYGEERVLGLAIDAEHAAQHVELTLRAGGRVLVRAQLAAGEPIEGVELEFLDDEGRSVEFSGDMRTNSRGSYTVNGLRLGAWTVRGTTPNGEVAEERFEVAREPRAEVTLNFQRR
jgi:hypothetical protein